MKALFCGLGSIGQRHLRNLIALTGGNVEILAYRSGQGSTPVLNSDMTVRAAYDELEALYNIRSYTDLREALAEKPDITFITNPNTLHLPVAIEVARAGSHLFIEKPVAHELDDVDTLVKLVDENNLVVFVAYQFRFHPGLKFIKSLLEGGKLGNLVHAHIVNGEYLPGWHPYEDYRQTHPARKVLGGGSLRIQTHEIDSAMWLFGMPRSVFAMGGHLSDLEVDVEDSVSILLDCEFPVHIHLDYLQKPPQRVCEVIGDRGKVRYDYYGNSVTFYDREASIVQTFNFAGFDRNQMFLDELTHFLDCVKSGTESIIGLQQGIESLKISLAADHSLHTGQLVRFHD